MIRFTPIVDDPSSIRQFGSLGSFPISRHYLTHREEAEKLYKLSLLQCTHTGLVYLSETIEPSELKPRFPWLTYREPSAHLNELAALLSELPGISKGACITGLTWKDDPLLHCLEELNFLNIHSVALEFTASTNATDQFGFTTGVIPDGSIEKFVSSHGASKVLIVRQGIEHASALPQLISQLSSFLAEDGYLVLEVPDCAAALGAHEHAILWEDHASYFTPQTLPVVLSYLGFDTISTRVFPYKFESSIVAIANRRRRQGMPLCPSEGELEIEFVRAQNFYREIEPRAAKYREALCAYRDRGFELSVLGAGHHACFVLQLLNLGVLFDRCLDDDPHKQGLFMPGCRLPIVSAREIPLGKRQCFILGIGPDGEDGALAKLRSYAKDDFVIGSLFTRSAYSILDSDK